MGLGDMRDPLKGGSNSKSNEEGTAGKNPPAGRTLGLLLIT